MTFFRHLLFVALSCLALCHGEEKPLILVSIPTYQGLLQELFGEDFCVESLVSENVNFHAFEPSMQKVLRYEKACLWFTIGDPFETRLEQYFRNQKQSPIIVCLKDNPQSQESCCCHELSIDSDPHSWTSPKMVREQCKRILSEGTKLFPQKKELFETNYMSIDTKLTHLIATVDDLLKNTRNKPLLIAHAAFGYLCHDYGIEQVALESGGKEPTPARLQKLLTIGKEHQITTVFAVKGFSKKGIDRIGEALHAKVVELDPYVCPYFESMEYTAREIKQALEAEKVKHYA
jgi:zinc transport system substrate-binding protein